jgi:nucleoside-diphosphate-sugar epimerase
MKQRILILGAENFVGTRVKTALAASDWATPVAFSGSPKLLSPETLSDIHAVFNGTMGSPGAITANARALYGALERTDSGIRVVHLSSMTVYGSFTGDALESTPRRSDLGDYGAAQVTAEATASRYPKTVILRPGCEYGPHSPQWSTRIARLLVSRRLGDLGADGDGTCNLLFVDDLVAAVMKAFRAPQIDGNAFNLAMRSPPTWNDYFALFGRALGAVPIARIGRRRLKIESKLLAPPLKILELLGRRLNAPAMAPPAITSSLLNLCGQNIALNVDKVERALDLKWTPLREGLRQTAAAYKGS